MGDDTELVARVDAVWKELMALKSTQNMAKSGLEIPAAIGTWSGTDSTPGTVTIITLRLRVTFQTNDPVSFTPLAFLAYRYGDSSAENFWYAPIVESVGAGSISWVIESSYIGNSRTVSFQAQVFGLLPGSITVERI